MTFLSTKPHFLVSVGLLWIAGYEMVLRLFHPRFLSNDLVHGLWLGVGLGLELLGLFLFLRLKQRASA